MDRIDNDLSNIVGTAPLAAGPNRDAFNRRYRDAYGVPTNFTPHGYDASAVLALASLAKESANSPLKNNVRPVAGPGGRKVGPDTLVEGARRVLDGDPIEYVGASSPVVFDSNGDMATATYEIWTYDSPDTFRREDTVSFTKSPGSKW